MDENIVLSGMRATGRLHLGNYLGALRPWVGLQDDHECIFCIVDYHAITIEYDTAAMQQRIIDAAGANIACGLDPERCTIFVQSRVPEHTELSWILSCVTPLGEVERMTQFKDKAQQHRKNVNLGLLSYPVLQAADILLYDTDKVPVGDDQRQHVEITRDIAIRFNHRFGDTFVVPDAVTPKAGARVMDLQDPRSKMSKSASTDTGCVMMLDDPKVVMKKFKRAVTDSDTGPDAVRYDRAAKPGVANLLEINAAVTGRTPQAVAQESSGFTEIVSAPARCSERSVVGDVVLALITIVLR